MKPKEYVKKYHLDIQELDSRMHDNFVVDIGMDFNNVLKGFAPLSLNRFELCVSEMKEKLEVIFMRSISGITSKGLWGHFYATIAAPMKDKLFGLSLKLEKRYRKKNE